MNKKPSTQYKLTQLIKNGYNATAFTRIEIVDFAFERLSTILKENRYEILGSFSGYIIVNNGYKQLLRVTLKDECDMETGKFVSIDVTEIIQKIKSLGLDCYVTTKTIVKPVYTEI